MKIEKKELLKVLNKIKYGTKIDNSVDDRLNSFIFTGNNIIAYNEKILLYADFETDFECIIPANKFIEIINKIKSQKIKIELKKNKLKITGKKTRATLTTIIHDEIYDFINEFSNNINETIKWKKLPDNFIEGVSINRLSVDRSSDNFSSCIFINDNKIISSDDTRISIFEMNKSIKDKMLIPGSILQDFIKFDFKKYSVVDSWAYFKSDDIVFVVRLFDDEFQELIDNFDFEGSRVKLPEELIESIDVAYTLSEGDTDLDKSINVKIEDGKITCRGKNDYGWSERTTDIKCKKNFNFSINPLFFKQILNMTNKIKIGEDRALFTTNNFKHLIALYQE